MIHQVSASIIDSVSYEITFVFVVIAVTLQVTYLSGKQEKFGNEREFYHNKFICGKCLSNKDWCKFGVLETMVLCLESKPTVIAVRCYNYYSKCV